MTSVNVKKYNPLEMSSEDILALATGREKLLNIMLTEMKVCLKAGSNQHFVLHGPRGIGKSFFTKLLKIHHDQSSDFSTSLFLQLPEEQENINYASDLLDVIATLLEGSKLIDTAPKWSITDMQWQKSKQRLKEALDEIKKIGKNHVFVTQENLQSFIPKLDKIESSRLREFLSDFDEVTIIGSSLRPDLDNDYSKRLFQVFKKLDIEPWTADNFLTYYDKLAQLSNYDKEQLENLKKSKIKIKAISQFTGGSPRLAVILSKLILEKNILDTAQLLDGIIDELTTYYQDITNDIPAKSKILFDMLIRKGENMTQSTLAASFEPPLEQKDIARSFAWLTDNYYVISSKQNKGNTKYFYVRDRLYVLYYQKRQVYADVPFSFVGVFVDFLNAFYSQKEWVTELNKIDLEHEYVLPVLSLLAKKVGLRIEGSTIDNTILRNKLLLKYNESALKKSSSNQSIKQREIIAAFEVGSAYYENGEYDKAINPFEKVIELNPELTLGYSILGDLYSKTGNYDKAISNYGKAISLGYNKIDEYYDLGYAYFGKGDFEKAIKSMEKGTGLNPESVKSHHLKFIAELNVLIGRKKLQQEMEIAIAGMKTFTFENFEQGHTIWLDGLIKFQLSQIILETALKVILRHKSFMYFEKYNDRWKGDKSFSSILGECLYQLIKENQDKKFFYFKNTFDSIRSYSFININDVINGLCIALYKDGDIDFLRQVVDELSHDFASDAFVKINLEVYEYLLNPEGMDINQLHPDVRTVVNSILDFE